MAVQQSLTLSHTIHQRRCADTTAQRRRAANAIGSLSRSILSWSAPSGCSRACAEAAQTMLKGSAEANQAVLTADPDRETSLGIQAALAEAEREARFSLAAS